MKPNAKQLFLAACAIFSAGMLCAQVPWFPAPPPSTNPMSQRSAQTAVQNQVGLFQNSTRTATSYGANGYGMVLQQFQVLRGTYNAFTATLNPQQVANGANELAELQAGLDILQEAFSNFQQDVADGQSSTSAFRNMCQVLNDAARVWLQEFNADCRRLRVGWQ